MSDTLPSGRAQLGSASWVSLSVASTALATLGLFMVMSRRFNSEELAIGAALLAVVSFPRMLLESAVRSPVIQRRELDHHSARTAASLAVGFSLVLVGLLWLGAAAIAGLFSLKDLERPLQIVALGLPLHGLATIPQGLLERELKFKASSLIDATGYIGGMLLVGSVLIIHGWGPMALAGGFLAEGTVRMVLTLIARPMFPTLRPDRAAMWQMTSFSSSVSLAGVLNLVATRGDYVVISRSLGPPALAAYTQAYQLSYSPGLLLGRLSQRWLFPVLARDRVPDRQGERLLGNLQALGFLLGPASVLTFVFADEIVRVVFGQEWIQAVAPLRILVVGLPFRILYKLFDAHATAVGLVARRAVVQGIYATLVLSLAALGALISLEWAAVGVVVAVTVNYLLMMALSISGSSLRLAAILTAHRPILVSALITVAALMVLVPAARQFDLSDLPLLLVGGSFVLGVVSVMALIAPALFFGGPKRRGLS
jgi:PST family polysaccharide transporter